MNDDGWQFWLLNRPRMEKEQAEATQRKCGGAQTRGALALLLVMVTGVTGVGTQAQTSIQQ